MAWLRMMGADSVAYHRETVLGRTDDHPGQALAYYAERGETPLQWGGSGAARLGLVGAVSEEAYTAIYGPGGAGDPATGERLVSTRRPGMELVIAAHKSVALLGVIGRAEHMHAILDAESDATLAALDAWMTRQGGRRGRAQTRVATHGLLWARTRHATSRAGDPAPHDHVLVANVVEMADGRGGHKALDTAALRDIVHAATMAGRVAAAARAIELGYAIEADPGPSGRLGHWRIAGMPADACAAFSKRSAEITAAVTQRGTATHQARAIAARATRKAKRQTPPAQLLPGWVAELEAIGHRPPALLAAIDTAGARVVPATRLSTAELRGLVAATLGPDGPLAQRKVFTPSDVTVAVGPALFGRPPSELRRAVQAVITNSDAIELLRVPGARERVFAPAWVLATEAAIAQAVASQACFTQAPAVARPGVARAIAGAEARLGAPLSAGQASAVRGICISGRGVELVLGVAGAGKTTALAAVREAFETAGFDVMGTATSGQAARTLGREAGIGVSRTLASTLWRVDHHRLRLSAHTVVILDEAGMTDDAELLRLVVAVEAARAKLVIVGDDRQLGAVGPGGGLGALLSRHPDAVHTLTENLRQRDVGERAALAELRSGAVGRAVSWYQANDRITVRPSRDEQLEEMVAAWLADVGAGRDAAMFAWRRANVEELNRRARAALIAVGQLSGRELVAPGGRHYAVGDRIVTLAPGAGGQVVTSERGTVTEIDPRRASLVARMDDGRAQPFGVDDISADRLAHGYAVTVHRSQGATVEVAHGLADGGGRELAYVQMSRARESSQVYVVADDLDQAVEDLRRAWSAERRPRWALDTGQATVARSAPDATGTAVLFRAAPPDVRDDLADARRQLEQCRTDRGDLDTGRGAFEGTEVGAAVRSLLRARADRFQAERFSVETRGMVRRDWKKSATRARVAERQATMQWEQVVGPVQADLDADIERLTTVVEELNSRDVARTDWLKRHPAVAECVEAVENAEKDERRREVRQRLGLVPERQLEREHGADVGIEL